MPARQHPNVVNIDQVQPTAIDKGRHRLKLRSLGKAAGSVGLSAALTEVPPGSVSFPRHFHCGNEEAIYVLSGRGIARIGEAQVEVRPGDWIALPPGEQYAHQMANEGTEPLVYLCVSTTSLTDVVLYPDSNKVSVMGVEPQAKTGYRHYGIFQRVRHGFQRLLGARARGEVVTDDPAAGIR